MKNFFLVSLALGSSMAFAVEVDYSRCTMLSGVQLDHEGKITPNPYQTIKSKKTDGNKETIVLESSFGNQKFQSEVVLERDDQGRVVKSTFGGDRPSNQTLQQYRDQMVKSAVMMAPMQTSPYQNQFMTQEPTYWLKKKNATAQPQSGSTGGSSSGSSSGSMGGMVGGFGGGMMDPNYEMVPLSKLTRDQAQEVGIDNAEELKRLRQQWKRDRKTTEKLRDGYKKIVERSALVVPMGLESEFEIKDGVCLPKSMSSRFYNSQSGQVNTFQISSREKCDKIRSIYQRHERKIRDCNEANTNLSRDYMSEFGFGGSSSGSGSGFADGGAVGGAVHGSMMGGGMVGGMGGGGYLAGGMGGGIGGGYGMGMFPGGGFGMGYMGADFNSISSQKMMCDFSYQAPQTSPTATQEVSGSGSGSQTQQQ